MKKKVLSLVISLALCLGLLPGMAEAVNETITKPLDFTNVGDGDGQTPAKGPGYELTGDSSNGYTLTLDGLSLNATEYDDTYYWGQVQVRSAIVLPDDGPVTVELRGTNTISASNQWNDEDAIAISGPFPVTIEGGGTLVTNVHNAVVASTGDDTAGNIIIKDVTIVENQKGNGIWCRSGSISIENANLTINAKGTNASAIYANKNLMIKNSDIAASCEESTGICAVGDITITGGTLTATSNAGEGSPKLLAMGNLTIEGGANVTTAGSAPYGIFANTGTMTLSQSEISANGSTLAIYASGGVTLKGMALIEPLDGTMGQRGVLNASGGWATSAKLAPVILNVPASPLTCTYGDTATAKVTLTTTPAITSTVEVYGGDTKLGEGNLGEEITINTGSLSAGNATLTAKLPNGLGEKDFTVNINPKPLTVTGATATNRAYDKTNEVTITAVALDGVLETDKSNVSVSTANLKGTISGSNVGTYNSVTLPELKLTGASAGNYTLTQPTGAVETSVTISKANYDGATAANASAKFGVSASFDLTSLLPAGAKVGTVSFTDEEGIFNGNPSVENGKLSYTLNDNKDLVNSTATVTIPVNNSTNYNDFSLTVTVTVLDKYAPRLTVNPITHVYNGQPPAITGTASNEAMSASNIPGKWAFKDPAPVNVTESGKKIIEFTPDEGDTYATATIEVQVNITAAPLSGKPTFTGGGSGKTLANVEHTEPETWPEGTFKWADGESTPIEQGKAYEYTFTPKDGNYQTYTGSEVLWARPSGGGGSVTPTVTTGTTTEGGTSTTQTTAVPSASNQNGTAAASVNTSMGDEIVKQAAANNSEAVVIAPRVYGSVTKTQVSVPASTLGQLGSQTGASLTVSTPVGDVTVPNSGLASLSGESGTVTFTAEKTGNSVDLSITVDGEEVQSIPGGISVTVPAENTAPGTVAVLIREDGTREVVRKSVADKDSVTAPLEGSARLELVDNSMPFDDVPAGHWAEDAVAFTSAHELFKGTGPRLFSPDQPMSRGMLAVALHNLESNPAQAISGIFDDVSLGQWYTEGVTWAAANGVVKGYGDGCFGPGDSITREQLAVMLWRYSGSPAAGTDLPFSDSGEASDWARAALSWAVEKGILNGRGNGILDPTGMATRAEAAQMLKNFMENW